MTLVNTPPSFHDDPSSPGQPTLVRLIQDTFRAHPDELALECDGQEMTYGELANVVDEQVERLHYRGFGRGTRVGVRLPQGSMHLPVAVLATICAGATCVPLDWEVTGAEARAVWEATGVAAVYGKDLVITARRPMGALADTDDPLPTDEAWLFPSPKLPASSVPTTVLTHRQAVERIEKATERHLADSPLGPGHRVRGTHTLSFRSLHEEMWLAWRHGATLVTGHLARTAVG